MRGSFEVKLIWFGIDMSWRDKGGEGGIVGDCEVYSLEGLEVVVVFIRSRL